MKKFCGEQPLVNFDLGGAIWWDLHLADAVILVLFACVGFGFFSTTPGDRLGRTSPK